MSFDLFWWRKADGVGVVDGMRLMVRRVSVVPPSSMPLAFSGYLTADSHHASRTHIIRYLHPITHIVSAQEQELQLPLRCVDTYCCIYGANGADMCDIRSSLKSLRHGRFEQPLSQSSNRQAESRPKIAALPSNLWKMRPGKF